MTDPAPAAAAEETLGFQAEVSRLLDIVVHSLYSDRRIFLRELISNASDACDRLRYAALTRPELTADDPAFKIAIAADKARRQVTVADNGIGMNRAELVEHLGTIARSGTAAFLGGLSGDARKDLSVIGQFGVGFYSAFMVAERVEVVSRRAGDDAAWRWASDGQGGFTVGPAERAGRGTTVTLHLRRDADEFLDPATLRRIVRQFSDHIAVPIHLDGEKAPVNQASALWTRPKAEVTALQYNEFYRHVAHGFDDPWLTIHWRAEGKIEYAALLFVPAKAPYDLHLPDRTHGVKLYVKRVFIAEDQKDLLPRYLRFLRGVIDSDDLPLNVSREMLQHNPVLALIRAGVVNRVLGELERKAKDDADAYAAFWAEFGAVLKEGLYEDGEHREALLRLARFRTTAAGDKLASLADYAGRMKPGQDAIFYLAGEDATALAASPLLEGYVKRGVEVLLLTDAVDEFWIGAVGALQDRKFKSVTRGAADLSKIAAPAGAAPATAPGEGADVAPLIALLRLTLQDAVKDVRATDRLADSPVCLVADETDLDLHLERLLRQHRQAGPAAKRILEINPDHPLIRRLAAAVARPEAGARVTEIAHLLLDQARLIAGETLPDLAGFARRLNAALERGLE